MSKESDFLLESVQEEEGAAFAAEQETEGFCQQKDYAVSLLRVNCAIYGEIRNL